jgi:hypothetical protein
MSLLHTQKWTLHITEHKFRSHETLCITRAFYSSALWCDCAWGPSTRLTAKHDCKQRCLQGPAIPVRSSRRRIIGVGTVGSVELLIVGRSLCVISEGIILWDQCGKCHIVTSYALLRAEIIGLGSPKGCKTLRLPHFIDNRLSDGGEVSLTRRPPFAPINIPVPPLVLSQTKGQSANGRIRSVEKVSDNGNRTRDHPACSIVPWQAMLPRAPPSLYSIKFKHQYIFL